MHATAPQGADAGKQLLEGERLREIVVGAGVEPADAVVDAVEGGEEEDGGIDAVAAERLADGEAVHAGEHDVEDDHVVRAFNGHVEALLAVERRVHGMAFLLQDFADELRESAFVFDDKYVHDHHSSNGA